MLAPSSRTPILDAGDPVEKREEIRRYFHATFDVYESLFEVLRRPETYTMRADPLRHPLIFYYGHTAVFFVNKLVLARLVPDRIDPALESIFAIGVDEMSWDDLDEDHYDWPTVEATRAYRDRVRDLVDDAIRSLPLTLPIGWESPFWPIVMGIEHERIHLETSAVLIRQLPIDQVRPHDAWPACRESGPAPPNALVTVPGGTVTLGKPRGHALFGWDLEYGRHEAEIAEFRASRDLVTNAEFRAFVNDGGYRDDDLWTEEGRDWVSFREPERPPFWVAEGDGEPRLRLMTEIVDMPWDWPVEVNQLEAKAFCNWKSHETGTSLRLPTEDEWHRLAEVAGVPDQPAWDAAPGNLNLEEFASSTPVTMHRAGKFHDVVGNVWQWTETPIDGFPGFAVHPLYDDFSTPTFDGRHNLIKGGSWISTGNEATLSARHAFRRHFLQFAGIRYVESEQEVTVSESAYEDDEAVAQYCDFHYGPEHFGVPNFPRRVARICLEMSSEGRRGRALDLGCAVGRATLELAREFEHVVGLDFSARFVRIAQRMVDEGRIRYVLPDEGDLVSYHEADLESFEFTDARERVEFWQADAANLKPIHTGFDLILAANLIDRLHAPRRFLSTVGERLNPDGLLVLTSPYTWLEEHTKREEWIGGFKRDGENVSTLLGLGEILGERFERMGEALDVPFVIRETKRKHQHTVAQLTVWRKQA